MKKLLSLTILAVAAIALYATCPKPSFHKERVTEATRECLNENVDSAVADVPLIGDVLAEGGKMIGNEAVVDYIDHNLRIDDYHLWSIGTLTVNGTPCKVSFGIAGHVFILDKDLLGKSLGHAIKDKAIDTAKNAAAALVGSLL